MAGRGGFSSKFGFIAAAAGSAVGLGNIWQFPFKVSQGGGAAFVLMYVLFIFILCFPIMIAEIAIGRKTQKNPVGAFVDMGFKKWSVIGILGIVCGILILSFYNVVAGWAFGYFLEISQGNFGIGKEFSAFTADTTTVGIYSTMFMLATAFIVSQGVSSGIEKASKILMPTLLFLLIGLVIYSLTLDGAMRGVEYYLIPDFSKITFKVAYTALGQGFFSLSLGMGALITYGSYVGKNDNMVSSAVMIMIADMTISLLSGLMMFALIASQGLDLNSKGGAGLIFTVLPGVFQNFGSVLGIIVGAAFFLLLSFAALTSTVSLLEVPVAYLVDEYKINRKLAVWGMALLIFLVGIPSLYANGGSDFFTNFITYPGADASSSFMDFVGHVANDTFLPLGGLLISIFTAYVWKKHNFSAEIAQGNPTFVGSWQEKIIHFTISYVCPSILGTIFILTVLDRFFGVKLI